MTARNSALVMDDLVQLAGDDGLVRAFGMARCHYLTGDGSERDGTCRRRSCMRPACLVCCTSLMCPICSQVADHHSNSCGRRHTTSGGYSLLLPVSGIPSLSQLVLQQALPAWTAF